MPYSVEIGDPVRIYDVVIRRSEYIGRRIVELVRSDGKDVQRLCMLYPDRRNGWTVGVNVDSVEANGPTLVNGFKTMRTAFEYAIRIRPDINRRGKASRGEI